MPRSITLLGSTQHASLDLHRALTALAGSLALALPARAAAPDVELQPERLARGADIAVPHIEDGDFVDGERRVELPGTVARGSSVQVADGVAGAARTNNLVDRRAATGARRTRGSETVPYVDVLRDLDTSTAGRWSADGSTLAWQHYSQRRAQDDHVTPTTSPTATVTRRKSLWPWLRQPARRVPAAAGWSSAPDQRGSAPVEATSTGQQRTVIRKQAGTASIEHDLLSIYTKDPYDGGCARSWYGSASRVGRCGVLPRPDRGVLTRRHATADLPHPHRRTRPRRDPPARGRTAHEAGDVDDQLVQRVAVRVAGTVLLEVNGKRKSATVRCVLAHARTRPTPCRCRRPFFPPPPPPPPPPLKLPRTVNDAAVRGQHRVHSRRPRSARRAAPRPGHLRARRPACSATITSTVAPSSTSARLEGDPSGAHRQQCRGESEQLLVADRRHHARTRRRTARPGAEVGAGAGGRAPAGVPSARVSDEESGLSSRKWPWAATWASAAPSSAASEAATVDASAPGDDLSGRGPGAATAGTSAPQLPEPRPQQAAPVGPGPRAVAVRERSRRRARTAYWSPGGRPA